MPNILEVNNLCKTYDGFKLKDISFSLPKGVIMGLIGENGAGKTTTIKGILNIISLDKGTIKVFNKDYLSSSNEIKEDLGLVLDGSFFHDNLKIHEISRIMGMIYKNWNEKEFYRNLDRLKVSREKLVKQLSKGMKMKLSIAVALSHGAKLLILDEPTSGLDPISREEVLDILLEFIQDEERSVLFSSHITSDLDKVADYISFIHGGKLVFSKDKYEILEEYRKIRCSKEDFPKIGKDLIIGYRKNSFGYEVLIGGKKDLEELGIDYIEDRINLEEIMIFYGRGMEDERFNS